jgi:hypothetical protein
MICSSRAAFYPFVVILFGVVDMILILNVRRY